MIDDIMWGILREWIQDVFLHNCGSAARRGDSGWVLWLPILKRMWVGTDLEMVLAKVILTTLTLCTVVTASTKNPRLLLIFTTWLPVQQLCTGNLIFWPSWEVLEHRFLWHLTVCNFYLYVDLLNCLFSTKAVVLEKHQQKMERVRAGKAESKPSWSTYYFSKLPGKVFIEVSFFFFFRFPGVRLFWNYSEIASKERPFCSYKHKGFYVSNFGVHFWKKEALWLLKMQLCQHSWEMWVKVSIFKNPLLPFGNQGNVKWENMFCDESLFFLE